MEDNTHRTEESADENEDLLSIAKEITLAEYHASKDYIELSDTEESDEEESLLHSSMSTPPHSMIDRPTGCKSFDKEHLKAEHQPSSKFY